MRLSIVLLLMLFTQVSYAGYIIRYDVTGIPVVASGQHVFYIEGERIKQAVSGHLYYLYDGSTDTLNMVDTNRRIYYPLSRTFFRDISNTVSVQEQRIKDILEKNDKLPEDARATLQQAIESMKLLKKNVVMLQRKNEPKVKIEGPLGNSQHKGVECNNYRVVASKSNALVCYAGFKQLGISPLTVKTFNSFQAFLKSISGFNSLFALLDGHLPLRIDIQSPIKGGISLGSISPVKMKPGELELPAGFQRLSVKAP